MLKYNISQWPQKRAVVATAISAIQYVFKRNQVFESEKEEKIFKTKPGKQQFAN